MKDSPGPARAFAPNRAGAPNPARAGRPLLRWLAGVALVAAGSLLVTSCGEGQPEASSSEIVTARTLGLAYLEEFQLDKAEEQFRKLVEMVPDEALGHANLGLVYLRTGRLDAAEEHLRRALELAPGDPRVRLILSRLYRETDRPERARELLVESLEENTDHVKTLYALAELAGDTTGELDRRREYLSRLVQASPGNVAARLELAEALLRLGESSGAAEQLEEMRQVLPELPGEASAPFEGALAAARQGRHEEALASLRALERAMEVAPEYQRSRQRLQGPVGSLEGFPVMNFSRQFMERAGEGTVLEALRFEDASGAAGLAAGDGEDGTGQTPERGGGAADGVEREDGWKVWGPPLAAADYDGDGDVDLVAAGARPGTGGASAALFRNELGRYTRGEGGPVLGGAPGAENAVLADYDNDGRLDVYLVRDGPNALFRQDVDGSFTDVGEDAGVSDPGRGREATFADLDHDGDLDLYVVNQGANRLYRNDLDGGFTDVTESFGVAGAAGSGGWDVAFADFDDDADLDLFVVNESGPDALYTNRRQGRFRDVAGARGVASTVGSAAVAVGDYDNDGLPDLFVGSGEGRHQLYRNRGGDSTFVPVAGSAGVLEPLRTIRARDAEFVDVDNDGHVDLLVVGSSDGDGRGVALLHNRGDGRFRDVSEKLPEALRAGGEAVPFDYNEDGDADVLLTDGRGRVRLLRNDGGNANRYLQLRLTGLSIGSGKNNHFGIGAKVEVRARDLYQVRTVDGPVTHIGLGENRAPDLVRIRWTNGVPQRLFLAAGDRQVVEEQTLKGSCAFLYTWNGESTEFLTDVIWRSALGMPVGIMSRGSRAYAPGEASREFVRIPGEELAPRDGEYVIQLTEELWETAYVDQVRLVAVDHPESVEIFVNERFRPSTAPADDRIYAVPRARPPVGAWDGEGTDLTDELRTEDEVHVANFRRGRYQGLTESHDLVLDPGPLPAGERVFLFLSGWVYPTDASINVAMSQSDGLETIPPLLQVRDGEGEWTTVVEDIGFPAGKEKTVVVELTDRYLSRDRRVRIRTSMQVYWDRAFFATGDLRAPVRRRALSPRDADIHWRGFSRTYRKGGRHGPHWFDYDSVSSRSPWLPIEGPFTRYGDVTELLQGSDDRYAVAGPGDEITVRFDARELPDLPRGWTRDFLFYSVGWIKDADLNTATGDRVRPLPFHAMSAYPYAPGESYPRDATHRRFLEEYLTREAPGPR